MKSKRKNSKYYSGKSITKGCLVSICLVLTLFMPGTKAGQELKLDERPAEPGEWGYR